MLIGREDQVAAILALLERAGTRRAAALRLVGGPGLGKTTLLDHAAVEASARDMHVVRMIALELEQEMPAAGLDILMRELGASDAPRTARGLLGALERASADRPLLLLIDDVQWLDDQTTSAVAFATRRLVADPVAVILAGRPDTDRVNALSAMPRLDVPPLSVDDSVDLSAEPFRRCVTTSPPPLRGPCAAYPWLCGTSPISCRRRYWRVEPPSRPPCRCPPLSRSGTAEDSNACRRTNARLS